MNKNIYLSLIVGAILFQGCSYKEQPKIETIIKEKQVKEITKNAELNQIVNDYLENNLLLKVEYEKIRQSFFSKKISETKLFPSLNASMSATKTDNNSKSYSLGINGTYNTDIWGILRNQIDNNSILEEIAKENFNEVIRTNVYQIKEIYQNITLINIKHKIMNLQEQELNKKIKILKNRYELGLSTLSEVITAETALTNNKISTNDLAIQKEELLNSLELLTNKKYMIETDIVSTIKVEEISFKNLLLRPDIKSASLGLKSQEIDVETSIKNRYPTLSLQGSFASQSKTLNFNDWIASIMGNIVFSIIDYNENKLLTMIENSKLEALKYNFSYLVLKANKDLILEQNKLETLMYNYNLYDKKLEDTKKQLAVLNIQKEYKNIDLISFIELNQSILSLESSKKEQEIAINISKLKINYLLK